MELPNYTNKMKKLGSVKGSILHAFFYLVFLLHEKYLNWRDEMHRREDEKKRQRRKRSFNLNFKRNLR